ncbi:LytR/AlgR family response regulator transcription factor [Taibaiella koreensis]|uniref:LytR/AlgR family response regulator transcription factor n=1 Tax=Taibaiella koreensis TaxID=1268548 RepID=UPI000E59EC44|nr:LytTR family transcriptional regulator DNA-binding domain-containing protein [Taibaiella koreensis]
MKISCYILDDEPRAIDDLIRFIEKTPILTLKGYATDPFEALNYLRSHEVDFLFLDISMDELSGLEFIELVPNKAIFTTAHEHHALSALSYVNTVDYLLKPITFNRFMIAIKKIEAIFLNAAAKDTEPTVVVASFEAKTPTGQIVIEYDKVDYIKANGSYSTIFYEGKKAFVSMPLNDIEALFPRELFARVHRSYIVHKKKIAKRTYYHLTLLNDIPIPLGRKYKEQLG